jgi:hypothetical protein
MIVCDYYLMTYDEVFMMLSMTFINVLIEDVWRCLWLYLCDLWYDDIYDVMIKMIYDVYDYLLW